MLVFSPTNTKGTIMATAKNTEAATGPVVTDDPDQTPFKKGAPKRDNPYAGVVKTALDDGKIKRITNFKDEAHLKTALSQVRRAARELDRSALVELLPADQGIGFRFQVVAKITRPRKNSESAVAAA